jgi:membrane associated rhomboid family serine protease
MIPARVFHPDKPIEVKELQEIETPYGIVQQEGIHVAANPPISPVWTLLTCIFLHGGWLHFLGNMWFLYIFGDNVEDAMGHLRYFFYYLACGVAAALVQVAVGPHSTVPMVGASGAIAGALGGYLVLHPRAPITVLNPMPLLWLFFGIFFVVPAWLMIGLWFLGNLFSGIVGLGDMASGGVAFFAHIGGFVAGLLLVRGAVGGRKPPDRGRWDGWRAPSRPARGWSSRSSRSW